MPGWYIHLDVARNVLNPFSNAYALNTNTAAGNVFNSMGGGVSTAKDLINIANNNPAAVALGAIGPDMFFLLADFKNKPGLQTAADIILQLYQAWDQTFLGPYQKFLDGITSLGSNAANALTGGLFDQLSTIITTGVTVVLGAAAMLLTRQIDAFSLLSSGKITGGDEQIFYWSDMFHYRKTYEFAHKLWQNADDAGDEMAKAYALGWMTHLATDVTGHAFVNEKCGGPYRLHWQRHHLIENHMDAKVYDSEYAMNGTTKAATYQMISCSALHLWIAFNDNGVNFLKNNTGPTYSPGDDSAAVASRSKAWDVDSQIPDNLANLIAKTIADVYNDPNIMVSDPRGQCASHPTNLLGGFPQVNDIQTAYSLLYKFVKMTTTDYYKFKRPDPPNLVQLPSFPPPPSFPSANSSDSNPWNNVLEVLLAILEWLLWLAGVLLAALEILPSILTSLGTYPVREAIYEFLEVPLYNMWESLHWYFAMTGFVYPLQDEISPGLVTLGVGVKDVMATLQQALNDPMGGLNIPPAIVNPPEGSGLTVGQKTPPQYPLDAVSDQANLVPLLDKMITNVNCGYNVLPSEFLRPWSYPAMNNAGSAIQPELSMTFPGPYKKGDDATILLKRAPGVPEVRTFYERAGCAAETDTITQNHSNGNMLGDPADYACYLIAMLTLKDLSKWANKPNDTSRPDFLSPIPNFDLDSDRGYGYLCWDWLRAKDTTAIPLAYDQKDVGGNYGISKCPPNGSFCGLVNKRGLTERGEFFIKQLMSRGMIIDVEHMSQKTVDDVLTIAEHNSYPVVSSHFGPRETYSLSQEYLKTRTQIQRIQKLGGVVAIGLHSNSDIDAPTAAHPPGATTDTSITSVPNPLYGSSWSWAQSYLYAVKFMNGKGVALGTDMNGLPTALAPRFGAFAGNNGITYDPKNLNDPNFPCVNTLGNFTPATRKAQALTQTNGVIYDKPIQTYNYYRFSEDIQQNQLDTQGNPLYTYTDYERAAWIGIAIWQSGTDPNKANYGTPLTFTIGYKQTFDGPISVALGFLDTSNPDCAGSDPAHQAAFMVHTGQTGPPRGSTPADQNLYDWYNAISLVWQIWQNMTGGTNVGPNNPLPPTPTNKPLPRMMSPLLSAGQRDFDFNLDGFAHYGMLPDFIQDLRNIGLTDQDLKPLLHSAEDYIQAWEKSLKQCISIDLNYPKPFPNKSNIQVPMPHTSSEPVLIRYIDRENKFV